MVRRLPLTFFLIGLAVKAAVLFAWKAFHSSILAKALITADPLAFASAGRLTALLFNQRRIAPTPAESVAFEIFLVLTFVVECLILGFIIRALINRSRGRPNRNEAKLNVGA